MNGGESYRDKTDPWRSLNCLVEVANSTKSCKPTAVGHVIKAEHTDDLDDEANTNKSMIKKHLHKSKFQEEKNDGVQSSPVTEKSRRLRVNQKQKDLTSSAHLLVNAASAQGDRRICPIWFQLIASADQLCAFSRGYYYS